MPSVAAYRYSGSSSNAQSHFDAHGELKLDQYDLTGSEFAMRSK